MTNTVAAVLFPDGEIRYGIYTGIIDEMHPALFDTINDAWVSRRGKRTLNQRREERAQPVYPVTIYSDYGDGFYWEGTATRAELISGFEPRHVRNGKPSWVRWTSDEEQEGTAS